MKNLFVSILIMSLCQSVFAGVREDVEALGKLAMGSDSLTVKGATAELLFKNFTLKEYSEEMELVFKEIEDMQNGDETDMGLTSVRSAKAMGGFYENILEENLENAEGADKRKVKAELTAMQKNWSPLIQKLHQQGVKFGYTGNGPGYCGVSFIELILIDVKGQKVYKVYLSESGPC